MIWQHSYHAGLYVKVKVKIATAFSLATHSILVVLAVHVEVLCISLNNVVLSCFAFICR